MVTMTNSGYLKERLAEQRKKQAEEDCSFAITDRKQTIEIEILSYEYDTIILSDDNDDYVPDWLNIRLKYYDGTTCRQWDGRFLDAMDVAGIAGMLRSIRAGYVKEASSIRCTEYSLFMGTNDVGYTVRLRLHLDQMPGISTGPKDINIVQNLNAEELEQICNKMSRITAIFPSRT